MFSIESAINSSSFDSFALFVTLFLTIFASIERFVNVIFASANEDKKKKEEEKNKKKDKKISNKKEINNEKDILIISSFRRD